MLVAFCQLAFVACVELPTIIIKVATFRAHARPIIDEHVCCMCAVNAALSGINTLCPVQAAKYVCCRNYSMTYPLVYRATRIVSFTQGCRRNCTYMQQATFFSW